ncbi:YhcH/YjgK/YiaL family protein [Helicobacter pametensis]|uniref:YhcH/YjgK/YiaL family protein n=1 Tax=Helicobacter pametensis TaxID=95149 RepID=UPI000485818F|nr:YhcH/YjgK/YiaL family protein [Helicobacter pametensis]
MAIFGTISHLAPLLSKTVELDYLNSQIQSLFTSEFDALIENLKEGESFEQEMKYGMRLIAHAYKLKPFSQAFFESHQRYIDFQIVLSGSERYLVGSEEDFKPLESYDEDRDLATYAIQREVSEILLRCKELCVLFPQDIHCAGVGREYEVGNLVKKVVIKVPTTLTKHRL